MTICEVVHFSPDPFVDRRVPLAAVLRQGASLRVVLASATPTWGAIGGWRSAALAAEALRALQLWDATLDGVPAGFEEVLVRGPGYAVPDSWNDAQISSHLWGGEGPRTANNIGAATLGRQFLVGRGVSTLVREKLDASTYAGGRFRAAVSAGVTPQYVELDQRLLLLEPLGITSSPKQVQAVARRLSVWKCAAQKHDWSDVKLVAYAVAPEPGIVFGRAVPTDYRVLEGVRDFADDVYDTRQAAEADALVQRIRLAA